VREYARRVAGWMEQSGWRDGCPISIVLMETAADEAGIRQAGREAFDGWDAKTRRGIEHDNALALLPRLAQAIRAKS